MALFTLVSIAKTFIAFEGTFTLESIQAELDRWYDLVHLEPASATQKLDQLLAQAQTIQQGVSMANESIAAVKADLVEVKADLEEIQTAVAGALETTVAQAAKIAELQGIIDGLVAGNVMTAEELAALKAASTEIKDQAEAVAAALRPSVEPPVEPV